MIAKTMLTALGPGLRRGDDEEEKSRGEHPMFLPLKARNTSPGQQWAYAGVTMGRGSARRHPFANA
jgi:hypothetical protein